MKGQRFQIGSVAGLFSICAVCVAVFCLLSVFTALTDRATARQYGSHISQMYECENLGQQWLCQADAWFAGSGELPQDTVQQGNQLHTQISRENVYLDIFVENTPEGLKVLQWNCAARWEPDPHQTLWK